MRPEWVCEVLSPSNWRTDLQVKRPSYGRVGVQYMWIVDPQSRTLWGLEYRDGLWAEVAVHVGEGRVRAVPFEAVEVDVAEWWKG